MAATLGLEVRALTDPPAERSRQGKAADRAVDDLEHVQGGVAHAEPIGGRLRSRRFVAHRFQQPADTPGADRRAEQHRNAKIIPSLTGKVLQDFVARGRFVHQQLLEELVVMIGKLFEHMGTRLGLPRLKVGGNVDALRLLARTVLERIFEGEIDEAVDLFSVPNGNLPSDER